MNTFSFAKILRYFVGILFLFSAIAKLFPIEFFEFTLVNQGIGNWGNVSYLSRFIIGIEVFIGLSFFQNNFIKKLLIPSAAALLIVFSVHLIYIIIAEGIKGNCGCFGELVPMSPVEALIKNILLIAVLCYMFLSTKEEGKKLIIPSFILIFSFIFVFFIRPVEPYQEAEINGRYSADKISSEKYPHNISQFSSFNSFSDSSKVNLDEGEKIVALLSLDCEHCMATAKKLGELKREISLPETYLIFLGEHDMVPNFFSAAETEFPYLITTPSKFFPLIEDFPPRVVYLINGSIIGDWNFETFSKDSLLAKLIH